MVGLAGSHLIMLKPFKFGNVSVGKKPIILAEAGVNHNCNLRLAERLISAAARAGADVIKFQSYKASELVIKKSPRFWSWDGEKKINGTQYDSYSELDKFNEQDYLSLMKICKKYRIEFMTTPFDVKFVDFFDKAGMKAFKVASCDITNYQLLKAIAKTGKPVFLSTGASNLDEIKTANKFLKKNGSNNVVILHCNLCYPTIPEDANLGAMIHLRSQFKNNYIGLSDHTLGIDMTTAALALGAVAIEKHFTVDKKLKMSADHWLSVDEEELNKLVINLNSIYRSLQNPKKKVLKSELKTRKLARRSLVTNCYIKKGQIIKQTHLTAKRPGTGISPMEIEKLVGKKTNRNLSPDTIIKRNDFI